MSGFAWVTLATNDSYSLGALVLAHSLRRANTIHQLAVLVTPGVTEAMRQQLSAVYNVVQVVDVLDSKDEANLKLLARPELGITFTKLNCWRLTQFSKCVFLDADTLVLQNCDELFEREELSAAPDAGWPDCFNSGVFVFRPSNDTFRELIDFSLVHGSFDGGDQGLLNLFFKDWATKDISKHLPFVYNMCSTATYSYLPAFKQFGENLKIVHFIGSSKPWLQVLDSETGLVRVSGESSSIGSFIQLWWDLFCTHVHTSLSTEMTRHRLSSCYVYTSTTSTTTYYPDPSFSPPPTSSNPRIRSPPPSSHVDFIDSYDNTPYNFTDPWDELLTENTIPDNFPQQNYYTFNDYSEIHHNQNDHQTDNCCVYLHTNNSLIETDSNYNHHETHTQHPPVEQNYNPPHQEPVIWHINETHSSNLSGGGNNENWNRPTKRDSFIQPERRISVPSVAEAPPSQNQHACPSLSAPSPLPSPSSVSLHQEEIHEQSDPDPDPDGGLAGALASVTLGAPLTSEQTALQEHLRRQGWEQGNIDYMGRDSFDNIWQKITETLQIVEATPQAEGPSQESLEQISQDIVKSTLQTPPESEILSAVPSAVTPPVTATDSVPLVFSSEITLPEVSKTLSHTLSETVPSSSSVTVTSSSVTSPPTPSAGALPSPIVAPRTPTVAATATLPTTSPVVVPVIPSVAETATSPVDAPAAPAVAASATPSTTSPVATPNTREVTPLLPKAKPEPLVPAAQPESPPITPTKIPPHSPINPSQKPTTPQHPAPLTPPTSPKMEVTAEKLVQPSTPTVTSPTPPTSPPVDPFEAPLTTKLKVDPETPGTPPAGGQSSTPTGTTDEPPVPPKRKGAKSSQEQPSKAQTKSVKPGKGKK